MIACPLCFVLMPFGTKKDPSGGPDSDFDRIYSKSNSVCWTVSKWASSKTSFYPSAGCKRGTG